MDVRQEILGIPQAWRETLEKGGAEYEKLIRETRWDEGPIYVVGEGASWPSALTAQYAFESLLGWPVVARQPGAFRTYTLPVLRPRSVVLCVSSFRESEQMVEAAQAARSRGAVLLVLGPEPASPIVKMSNGMFLLRTGEGSEFGIKAAICQHAALNTIALMAARIFKRQDKQADTVREEFTNLPERIEWVFTQLADAVRSFASEIKTKSNVCLVGGGFYHPAAIQAASLFKQISLVRAEGFESSEFRGNLRALGQGSGVVFVSGTRCRLKKEIHHAILQVRKTGAKTLSITDANDGELANRSEFAILLPMLSEMAGATLAMALLAWVAHRAAERKREPGRSAAATRGPIKEERRQV